METEVSHYFEGLNEAEFKHINSFYEDENARRQEYLKILFGSIYDIGVSSLFEIPPLVMIICNYCKTPELPENLKTLLNAKQMFKNFMKQQDVISEGLHAIRQEADELLQRRLRIRREGRELDAKIKAAEEENTDLRSPTSADEGHFEIWDEKNKDGKCIDLVALQRDLNQRFHYEGISSSGEEIECIIENGDSNNTVPSAVVFVATIDVVKDEEENV